MAFSLKNQPIRKGKEAPNQTHSRPVQFWGSWIKSNHKGSRPFGDNCTKHPSFSWKFKLNHTPSHIIFLSNASADKAHALTPSIPDAAGLRGVLPQYIHEDFFFPRSLGSCMTTINDNSKSLNDYLLCGRASQVVLVVKNLPPSTGDSSSIPALGRSPGEGNGNPLWYSWEIPRTEEPGGLQSMGSRKSWTWLNNYNN